MFDAIRRQTKSTGTYILVGLLIVIFAVFFGGPMGECGDSALRYKLAKVNKTTIYNEDLNIVYYRSFGGGRNVSEEEYKRQQADSLQLVIIIQLLSDKATELDLRVSDEELRAYLVDPLRNREYAIYNRNGSFSPTIYKNYVQHGLNSSPREYENFKRRELLAAKYVNLFLMQASPSQAEIEETAKVKLTKVDLSFLKFDPTSLSQKVPLSEDNVENYLNQNKDEVENYYKEHLADYTTPERISVRRIYISRPDASEGDDLVDAATEKWQNARKRILDNHEDFATVAKDLSEDFAKDNGGLIDWTNIDNIDQDIAKGLQGENVGSIKEISTSAAYMLVKLEGREPQVVTPFDDVKSDIARLLLQTKEVNNLIASLTSQFQSALQSHPSFEDALKSLQTPDTNDSNTELPQNVAIWDSLSIDSTGDFTQAGRDLSSMFGSQFVNLGISSPWDDVPKVGKSPELAKAAFTLTEENPILDKPIKVKDATYLFELKSRSNPTNEDIEGSSIRSQLIASAISPFLLPIQGEALLFRPLTDYGHLIDQIYYNSIESKNVKFYNAKQWPGNGLVRKDSPNQTQEEEKTVE